MNLFEVVSKSKVVSLNYFLYQLSLNLTDHLLDKFVMQLVTDIKAGFYQAPLLKSMLDMSKHLLNAVISRTDCSIVTFYSDELSKLSIKAVMLRSSEYFLAHPPPSIGYDS